MAHWRVPRWVPKTVRVAVWKALDEWKLDPIVANDLSALQRRLGLPVIHQSVFGQWVHSPLAGVTLFLACFAAAPSVVS